MITYNLSHPIYNKLEVDIDQCMETYPCQHKCKLTIRLLNKILEYNLNSQTITYYIKNYSNQSVPTHFL